jgi:hypothetical protein
MITPKNPAAVACKPHIDSPADRKHLPRGVCRFCGRKALAPNSRICIDGAEILAERFAK